MKIHFYALLILVTLGLGGCTYYQIHDPHSGKTYYTNNWESKGVESGVIVFKDAATGSQVTLASHEIKEGQGAEVQGIGQQTVGRSTLSRSLAAGFFSPDTGFFRVRGSGAEDII